MPVLHRRRQEFYTDGMEVRLSAELEVELNRMAAQQGRNRESLVSEAVERKFVREGGEIGLQARVVVIPGGAAYFSMKSRFFSPALSPNNPKPSEAASR